MIKVNSPYGKPSEIDSLGRESQTQYIQKCSSNWGYEIVCAKKNKTKMFSYPTTTILVTVLVITF